jgi:hypothetical protein
MTITAPASIMLSSDIDFKLAMRKETAPIEAAQGRRYQNHVEGRRLSELFLAVLL